MMTRVSLIVMIILAVMVAMVVSASPPPSPLPASQGGGVEFDQVVPMPERTVGLQILPGEDGKFYVFCTGACDRFLSVADVSELHAGFDLATDAHNHGLILMARLNGGVARLLPGTVFTPTP
ncbi:MAG: hypothetical protein RIC84_08835 [Aggregatilineales bacterium]